MIVYGRFRSIRTSFEVRVRVLALNVPSRNITKTTCAILRAVGLIDWFFSCVLAERDVSRLAQVRTAVRERS